MLNRLFNLILIVTILSCPFRCQLDQCGCCGLDTMNAPFTDGCDADCCDAKTDPTSFPSPEQPCKQCQCMCAGATLPDYFVFDATGMPPLHGLVAYPSLIESSCFSPMKTGSLDLPRRPPSGNRGRIIRCWHQSLII